MSKTSLNQNDLDFMTFALGTQQNNREENENISISPEDIQFAYQAQNLPRPEKEITRGRSIASAPVKGFLNVAGKALGAMPTDGRTYEETIEEILPTQKGRFLEGALQRGAEIASSGGARGFTGILKSILAGAAGEGVSQAPFIPEGAKPYAEFGAEAATLGLPALGKKIQPTLSQAGLLEEARRLGLTEKEIAPLIQEDKKLSMLSKIASKRGRAEKALKESKKAVDLALESMDASPSMKTVLAPQQAEGAISRIEEKMVKKLNTAERNLIKEDLNALKNSPKAAEDFIKFFRDINKEISKNPKSKKALNLLKTDIVDSVKKISPELGDTFETTNKLYSNYSKIAEKLNPNWNEDIAKTLGTGVGHVITGTLFGNYWALATIAGEQAAKKVAREMLINPRFQNLSRQITQALNSKKLGLASRLWDDLSKLVGKTSPQIAMEMSDVDWDNLQDSTMNKEKIEE